MAEEALKRIRENNYQTYKLSGIVFMDCMKQEKQYKYPDRFGRKYGRMGMQELGRRSAYCFAK